MADLLEMLSPTVDLDVVFRQKRGGGGVPKMAWPSEEDTCVGKVKGEAARPRPCA